MRNKIHLHKVLFFLLVGLCFWHSAGLKKDILRRIPSDNYTVNFENPDLLRLANESTNEIFRIAVTGPSNSSAYSASYENFYPGFAQAHGFETSDGYLSLFSKRYEDFWLQVVGPLRSIDPSIDKRWGNIAAWIYLYAPFDRSFEKLDFIEFARYYDLDLLSLANTKYIISRWPLKNESLKLVSEPGEIKTQREKWSELTAMGKMLGIITGQVPHRALYIYENTACLPRTFVVHNTAHFKNSQTLLTALSKASISELRTTVFLIEDDNDTLLQNPNGETGDSSSEIIEYLPDELTISVKSNTPGILVLTNNYSPYWKCWVNGVEVQITPAYHTFQAVRIPAGEVTVSFKYRPPYFFCRR